MLKLQIFLSLGRWLGEPDILGSQAEDPLHHPQLMRMTSRELADLPLSRPERQVDIPDGNEPALTRCA
jgi:hypothetical protein